MERSPEIEAIVRRWAKAREAGDVELADSFFSRSDHLMSIGSDENEWTFGAEMFVMTAAHIPETPTEKMELLQLHAFEHGEVGWAAMEQRRTSPSGRPGIFRQTFVFVLEMGAWKIVHNHFSAPVSNLDAFGADLTNTLSDLVDSVVAEPQVAAAVTGTATLVFTDLVDSTPLSIQLGEKKWSETITSHFDAVQSMVESEGGIVVKTLGDGGMYAFDSGAAALRAAAGIQRIVAAMSDPELQVRIGVHTGDVVQTEGDFLGSTVAKAARVAAAAQGGEIMVSSSTAGMVTSNEFDFELPKSVELKGLDGMHQLQPLNWK